MCKQIPLSNGQYIIVDDDDYENVSKHGWCLFANGHVIASIKNKPILLTRFLMGKAPQGMKVIHINYDGLDYRRSNLVHVEHKVAGQRKARKRGITSKYKGVNFVKRLGKWHAVLSQNCHPVSLGWFDCELEAARAYDKAALEHYGKYAKLNLPKESFDSE